MSRLIRSTVIAWWLLPVHVLLSVALALVLLTYVQGRQFRVNQGQHEDASALPTLAQPTLIALVSAVLTVVRAVAGSVVTMIGWQMALIALKTRGTTLADVDYMISWRRPPVMGSIFLWTVFILSIPSQFSSPVLQGAINWIPDTRYMNIGNKGITTPGKTDWWNWHNLYTLNRYYEVSRATGLTGLASPDNFQSFNTSDVVPSIPSRRQVPSLMGVPVGSKVANISMPLFKAHSIQWARKASDLGNDTDLLQDAILNQTFPALGFSADDNLFSEGTERGRIVMVNTHVWKAESDDGNGSFNWPVPTIRQQSSWVILGLFYGENCSVSSDVVGPINGFYTYTKPDGTGCFLFAKLNYTAGVIQCRDCNITSPRLIEASANSTAHTDILPDPMVENAIAMIPEVMFSMMASNSTLAPTWQNFNGYAVGMVATAYQASWNALMNHFHQDNMVQTELSVPLSVLRAHITTWRIWLWFGLNLCLTAAGFVLGLHQWTSGIDVAQNPALTALLINPAAVFQKHPDRFGNVNDLNKEDLAVVVALDKTSQPPRLSSAGSMPRRRLQIYGHSPQAYRQISNDFSLSEHIEHIPMTNYSHQGGFEDPSYSVAHIPVTKK